VKRGRKKERMRRKDSKGEEKYEREAGSRQEKKCRYQRKFLSFASITVRSGR
jgi:hypothetical protein